MFGGKQFKPLDDNQNGEVVIDTTSEENSVSKEKKSLNLTYFKVFGFFGLALLITAVTAFVVSSILYNVLLNDVETYALASMIISITSAFLVVILSFGVNLAVFKKGHTMTVLFVAYSIVMGCLLSGLAFYVSSPYTLAFIFLATALVFLIMCGVGALLGNKVKLVYMILGVLLIGSIFIVILNLCIMPFLFVNESLWSTYSIFYWILEFVFIAILCIYIAIDMNRLKRLVQNNINVPHNLALYFATSLYTDFIALFVRIFYLIIRLKANDN